MRVLITPALLAAACPRGIAPGLAERFAGPLDAAAEQWGITTPLEVGAWLAQLAHESASFRALEEFASGEAYEGRRDLGNTEPGDGRAFKGVGLVMLTGRANHTAAAQRFGKSLEDLRAWALTPDGAAQLAAWYCTEFRDIRPAANLPDFRTVTRVINGGLNGLEDREARYKSVMAAIVSGFGEQAPAPVEERAQEPGKTGASEAQGGDMPLPLIPILGALLPALIDQAPKLIEIFGDPKKSPRERNIAAALQVADIAQKVTQAPNLQAAAEQITSDPAVRQKFAEAIEENWPALVEVGGGVTEARKWNEAAAGMPAWKMPAMWMAAMLLPMVYLTIWAVFYGPGWPQDIRSATATLVIGTVLGAVCGFFFGSSFGSAKKDGLAVAAARAET